LQNHRGTQIQTLAKPALPPAPHNQTCSAYRQQVNQWPLCMPLRRLRVNKLCIGTLPLQLAPEGLGISIMFCKYEGTPALPLHLMRTMRNRTLFAITKPVVCDVADGAISKDNGTGAAKHSGMPMVSSAVTRCLRRVCSLGNLESESRHPADTGSYSSTLC
jgi:hypothetical protein